MLSWPARMLMPTEPGAFRLLLAMLVFVYHFSSLGLGFYAVFVFFILSGFWVQGMWTRRYAAKLHPWRTYLVSRVWRLAPAMLLASALTIPVLLMLPPERDLVFTGHPLHLLFSSAFLLGYSALPYAPVGVAWSLDVEMQFYLAAPLVAAAMMRFGWRPVLAGAAIVTAAMALFAPVRLVPTYAVFFAMGMAGAHAGSKVPRQIALGSAALVIVIVAATIASPWSSLVLGGAHPGPLNHLNVPFNGFLAILSAPFALYTVRQPSDGTDRMFGDLSYLVYLLHWPAMQWFQTIQGPMLVRLPAAAACFVMIPLLSLAVWRWFDHPINQLRAGWVERQPVARESAGKKRDDSANHFA